MSVEARLKELGIALPSLPKPLANYVGAVRLGEALHLSGHIPVREDGTPAFRGKLGRDLTVEEGYQAARLVGLNLLGTARAAAGSLDRIRRIVKVLGMVSSAEGFTEQTKVINGFSDLMVEVFGDEIGRHARSAFGVAELPLGVPVEIEMVVAVDWAVAASGA